MEKELQRYFDHTLLKAEATAQQIEELCREAREYGFYAVCVNGGRVPLAVECLRGSEVRVAAVVGFPLGACGTAAKAFEAAEAVRAGAEEIDMVISVGQLLDGDFDGVREDIRAVVSAAATASGGGAIVKVILETGLLRDDQIVRACQLAEEAGAAFVKTSTGFGPGGATAEHVDLMKRIVGGRMQVKASGGIRDLKTALAMIEAGADRIGASASVRILEEYRNAER